jgi:hypothetical protein
MSRQKSKIESARPFNAPGNREGSGSSPTQSRDWVRDHAALSDSMKDMGIRGEKTKEGQ